ncbi:ribosome biogenesis GTPase Der [Candidatus Legionella polyplacis]|uniref:ribosome biogenesis GTPase Der n=1 Tax=Candidatus Legionella polyplacis TaxID=2005262 RepID=UPI000C1DE46A|nr:ribosome biogenesis GTPase Der [Candidatus Legionella polyplacis]ATW02059.1 ribosome biogenesis GTPase Der [Candidatus Legionella polyplacis]
MSSIVALVGASNVGKSTLFNVLTKSKNIVTSNFCRLTRDRHYGIVSFRNYYFTIIDTSSFSLEKDLISSLQFKQTKIALMESNCILFLVDGKSGISLLDENIVKYLKKINKLIYLVVNKTENLNMKECLSMDFKSLGFKFDYIYFISALYKKGISNLLKSLFRILILSKKSKKSKINNFIKIAFVGKPNVGKSTMINSFLNKERTIVHDLPGTTRDSVSVFFKIGMINCMLFDTAGIRKTSKISDMIEKIFVSKTLKIIKESKICILVLDATTGISFQDTYLIRFIMRNNKVFMLVVNKSDLLNKEDKKNFYLYLKKKLAFICILKIYFVSALYGSGITVLKRDIKKIFFSTLKNFSTSQLTFLLMKFTKKYNLFVSGKNQIAKLKFAHVGGLNPLTIVIHGNNLNLITKNYKRYLLNSFIKNLNLVGNSLKLEFKTNKKLLIKKNK